MARRQAFDEGYEFAVVTAHAVPGQGRTHATYSTMEEAKGHISKLRSSNPKAPSPNLKVVTRPKAKKR